ncbi:MAG: hypothetical protein JNN32_02885 [Flavobacteriales bacterium]|nr:hypothetical protein [Flavobacteriales bacterium]
MSQKHWVDEFFRKRLEKEKFAVEEGELEEVRALLQGQNGTTTLIRGGRFSKWWLSALIPVAGLLWWGYAGDSTDDRIPRTASLSSETEYVAPGSKSSRVGQNGNGTAATPHPLDANDLDPASVPSVDADDTDNALVNGRNSVSDDLITSNSTKADQPSKASGDRAGTTLTELRGSSKGSDHLQQSSERSTSSDPAVFEEQTRSKKRSAGLDVHAHDGTSQERTIDPTGNSQFDPFIEPKNQTSLTTSKATEQTDAATTIVGQPQSLLAIQPLNDGPATIEAGVSGDPEVLTDDQADNPMSAGESMNVGLRGQGKSDAPFVFGAEMDRVAPQPNDTIDSGTTDRTTGVEALEGLLTRMPDHENVASGEAISREIEVLETMALLAPRYMQVAPAATRQPMNRTLEVIKFLSAGELHTFGAPLNVRTRTSGGGNLGPEMGSLFGFEYRVRVKRFTWSTGILYGNYAIRTDQGEADLQLGFVEIPLLGSYKLMRGRFGVLLQGGLTADLLFSSTGRYPAEEDRRSVGFPEDSFRTTNYSWLMRPQAVYNLDEHLSISAGPLWKAQLGEVAQEGPLDGARISSTGITIGLSWRLERATF